ncbi:hypothetical protein ACFHW2_43265 [Actinomadura sp. LOL_016]|uniref:hypothetical protein n=1 Tax=unclassified Actinomadura TaxID=2626254 RepID=UPI003A80242C
MPSPNVGAPVRFIADPFAPSLKTPTGTDPEHLFRVRQLPDGWEARAAYPITPFMAQMGCRSVLTTGPLADLSLRTTAERVRVGLVRAAEKPPTGAAPAQVPGRRRRPVTSPPHDDAPDAPCAVDAVAMVVPPVPNVLEPLAPQNLVPGLAELEPPGIESVEPGAIDIAEPGIPETPHPPNVEHTEPPEATEQPGLALP